jgi:hypothetical protein
MTTLPNHTPFYGGGQVANPANVLQVTGAPTDKLTEDNLGTVAVDNSAATAYMLCSKSGAVDTWVQIAGSGSGSVTSVTGTALEITASPTSGAVVLSLPSAITAPGSLATTTTLTAGTGLTVSAGGASITGTTVINNSGTSTTSIGAGTSSGPINIGTAAVAKTITIGNATGTTSVDIYAGSGNVNLNGNVFATASIDAATTLTATNGNLVLGTAGNKLEIAAGSNASVGVTAAMTAGVIVVSTTAVTASSLIFYSVVTPGGTVGTYTITKSAGVSFTITSTSGTETSTFNYLIIN